MSDFMKSIVEEVLQRNSPVKGKPSPAANGSIVETPTVPVDIKRPNYQRERAKQRLSPIVNQSPGNTEKAANVSKGEQQNVKSPPLSRNFVEDALSPLQRLSLVQGNVENRNAAWLDSSPGTGAQLIGKTRDECYVWFYPGVHRDLPVLGEHSNKFDFLGIVTAGSCYPGQLFLIEEALREAPELKYEVTWDKAASKPFVFKLYGNDSRKLEHVLKEIYLRFNRRSLRVIESYVSPAPSPLLIQNFGIKGEECVAVLEGVSYYNGIGLLDRFFKRNPDVRFQFQAEDSYLLLKGEEQAVSTAIRELKKEADRLL